MMALVWCDCQNARVAASECDGCDAVAVDDDWGLDQYADPPLYPRGYLAGLTLAELEREIERQCDRQGALGDAERIDERAVELTEARYHAVKAEIERRKKTAELGAVLGDALARHSEGSR